MTSSEIKFVSDKRSMVVLEIFLCCGEHKFDAVQLVYFRCSRVIINSNDVGKRVLMAYFLDDAFAYHMIWQTAKGLRTYNICGAGVN